MIEVLPETCSVSSFVYRAVANLYGEEVAERFWYEDGETNGLYQRSIDGTDTARLEPYDDRHRPHSAAPGQWRAADHPAPVAETVPP